MSIPKEYVMADQEILTPGLPLPRLTAPLNDPPALSKMVCMFPDCIAQGDSVSRLKSPVRLGLAPPCKTDSLIQMTPSNPNSNSTRTTPTNLGKALTHLT